MARLSALLASCMAFCATIINATPLIKRASLTQVSNYGSNPAGVPMYIYVPNKLASSPGIIVAVHYCSGSAQAYYSGSPYATLAETYGFIVIYPSSPHSGTCWDVSSKATLTHNGGGDSNSIANMVTWTISQYNADSSKVFVTGSSSGAMMTNVLCGTYPDIFKAGIAYSGVPAGCFVSSSGTVDAWNSTCALGQQIDTPTQWANVVKDMYPGYTGSRPKMQIYHGSADTTLYPQNYYETCKQWCGVFGYNYDSPASITSNSPLSGYTRTDWGPSVEGIYAQGVGHSVPIQGTEDMKWFGFSGGSSSTGTTTTAAGGTTSTKTTTTATATTTTTSSGGTVALWGQCGGTGYTGATTCASGTCKYINDWYSQCQ